MRDEAMLDRLEGRERAGSINLPRVTVLCAVPTPPPYSGPEIVGQCLLGSSLGEAYEIIHVRTSVGWANREKGRITIGSLRALCGIWLELVSKSFRYRPQVVLIFLSQNLTGFMRDAVLIATARAFGARIVAQIHGSNFANFYHHAGRLGRRLIRRVLSKISIIVLLAERFRGQMEGLIPPDRIRILYNGIDAGAVNSDDHARLRSDKTLTVLYVGHLSIAKGFGDVLEAAPQVLETVPGLKFVFVGEWLNQENNIHYDEAGQRLGGHHQSVREQWLHLVHRYNGRLQHLGVLGRTELTGVLEAADIFVLPSYSEGMPMAVLEAMAVGLPLVVTPVGALPEILEDRVNAIFIRPGDVEALVQAILTLASYPCLRRQMGRANQELAKTRFSLDRMARGLAEIFEECLADLPA